MNFYLLISHCITPVSPLRYELFSSFRPHFIIIGELRPRDSFAGFLPCYFTFQHIYDIIYVRNDTVPFHHFFATLPGYGYHRIPSLDLFLSRFLLCKPTQDDYMADVNYLNAISLTRRRPRHHAPYIATFLKE